MSRKYLSVLVSLIALFSVNTQASVTQQHSEQVSAAKSTVIAVFEENTVNPKIFYKVGNIAKKQISWHQVIEIGHGKSPDVVITPDSNTVFLTYVKPSSNNLSQVIVKRGDINNGRVRWQSERNLLPKDVYGVSPKILVDEKQVTLSWQDIRSKKKQDTIHTLLGNLTSHDIINWNSKSQLVKSAAMLKPSSLLLTNNSTSVPDDICKNGVLTIFPELVLRSQDDVNYFGQKYKNCHYINSKDVQIAYSDISDLSPLSGINEIWGDLDIIQNDSLESLSGLDSLTTVSGDISISKNAKLANIGALTNITHVFGDLDLISNPLLTDITGVNNVTAIEGNMVIHGNGIAAIDNLNSLTRIGQDLTIGGVVDGGTADSEFLKSIEGFQALSYLGGDLEVSFNDNLTSIKGFSNLNTVNGSFSIEYSDKLQDLQGFSSLAEVNKDFEVSDTSVTNLDNFSKLQKVGGGVTVTNDSKLTQIESLKNLLLAKGSLYVSRNKSLKSLEGLNNLGLIRVSDDNTRLMLQDNTSLSDCSAICGIYNDLTVNKIIGGNGDGCTTSLKNCR
ncbi:hypothetical protein [Parashewanella tropica]|uniref:hypothetical protein n=1 Tax=Parashewanella tropica TaxID=2547970 RepID=UPI0010593032|nr:hypothetical protein [Parashewanella tropica]